jgi:hypothetical protein
VKNSISHKIENNSVFQLVRRFKHGRKAKASTENKGQSKGMRSTPVASRFHHICKFVIFLACEKWQFQCGGARCFEFDWFHANKLGSAAVIARRLRPGRQQSYRNRCRRE